MFFRKGGAKMTAKHYRELINNILGVTSLLIVAFFFCYYFFSVVDYTKLV